MPPTPAGRKAGGGGVDSSVDDSGGLSRCVGPIRLRADPGAIGGRRVAAHTAGAKSDWSGWSGCRNTSHCLDKLSKLVRAESDSACSRR